MNNSSFYCLCCGRDVARHQYLPGKQICALCNTMDANDVAIMTFNTINKRQAYLAESKAGRKEARVLKRLEAYAITGKRCGAGQHYLPISAFGACATRGDGLQANCKGCNKIFISLMQSGNSMDTWHKVRDAMRVAATGPLNGQVSDIPIRPIPGMPLA